MNGAGSIAQQKTELRSTMRVRLQEMDAEERRVRSEKIVAQLIETTEWIEANVIALFEPMRIEPDVRPLREFAAENGKEIAVIPRTALNESDVCFSLTPTLVLVPGLAFTRDGARLGRGGGFYDRLLNGQAANAIKFGICFEFQVVDFVPSETHDVLLDAVVTDA